MKKIEYILKMIPLFSFFLIIASSIKLAVYYKVFKINIVDYLSISEYVPLFLDDLHNLLYFSIISLSGFFFGRSHKKKKNEKEYEKKTIKVLSIIGIVSSVVIYPTIVYYTNDSIYNRLEHFGSIFLIFMCSTAMLYLSINKKISLNHFLGWLLFLLLLPVIISGYRDAHQIIENKREVKYEVSIKEKKLDKGNLFLGKSDKYVFFFNTDKKKSIIYPMSDVDKIDIIILNKTEN
ncbi:hypothetical protein [Polaribacter porphyrae]|uniref:Uncharacterized protein n=1 Tax=Polaribacter porphyrae TaxID=1137780 RepID=A0A2S7WKA6_9FLAO|nr:hypothetical protein [Polaribacter porphyrae]PQJ78034.1 hypothetical protein BTO18_01990 [Polaribacter porphyrae]